MREELHRGGFGESSLAFGSPPGGVVWGPGEDEKIVGKKYAGTVVRVFDIYFQDSILLIGEVQSHHLLLIMDEGSRLIQERGTTV